MNPASRPRGAAALASSGTASHAVSPRQKTPRSRAVADGAREDPGLPPAAAPAAMPTARHRGRPGKNGMPAAPDLPPAPAAMPAPRRRGRPSKGSTPAAAGAPVLSREQILDQATRMAKVEPLGEISMVGLARELGVAPTLIHYYVGSRDDLISGVANRYFKERYSRLQPLTGDWQEDLRREAQQSFDIGVEYGGVLRYMMSHNRFRLFQQVGPGETDYGVLYLDRVAGILRDAGFAPAQAALCYHLLAQYVMSCSYAEVSKQLPAYHERYIQGQIASHPVEQLPGAHFFAEAFSSLDSAAVFPQGLRMLIDSFAAWLEPARPARPAKAGATARKP